MDNLTYDSVSQATLLNLLLRNFLEHNLYEQVIISISCPMCNCDTDALLLIRRETFHRQILL